MKNGKLISEDRGRVVWFVSSFSSLPVTCLQVVVDLQEAHVIAHQFIFQDVSPIDMTCRIEASWKIEAKKRHNHFVIHILPRLAKGNSQQAYVSVDVNHLACFPICSIFGSKRARPDFFRHLPECP